jgi:hypothetical protein
MGYKINSDGKRQKDIVSRIAYLKKALFQRRRRVYLKTGSMEVTTQNAYLEQALTYLAVKHRHIKDAEM